MSSCVPFPIPSRSIVMGMLQSRLTTKEEIMSKYTTTHWHRHSYPSQTPPAQLPHPPPSNQTTPSTVRPLPQVPATLRATRASSNASNGRTIIICLDGTGDKFDDDNSNIVHLVSCLKKADPNQVTYYQSGIGTYDGGGLSNGLNAAMDMAVGSGLGVHVRDAYRFLMQTYKDGDKICLFGFSRGAYTARCLAGMIHKVGLLPAHNISQIQFAYEYYKDDSEMGWTMSGDFKRTFCADVNVYFVGVFDSVASVGFVPRKLPLSSTPRNRSHYFRHALALDERRAKFKPCRYQARDSINQKKGWKLAVEKDNVAPPAPRGIMSKVREEEEVFKDAREYHDNQSRLNLAQMATPHVAVNTDVLEVWFAGCHADVGGGAVRNAERHKLSQIPLRWMIRQCFECNTGILFNSHRLAEEGLDVHTLWPEYIPPTRPTIGPPPSMRDRKDRQELGPILRRSSVLEKLRESKAEEGHDKDEEELYEMKIWADEKQDKLHEDWVPEQHEDYFDAMEPIHDQLKEAKGWWTLEYIPIKVRVQLKESDAWIKKVRMNLGRYRPVQEHQPNLHWTVQQKMYTTNYTIRTRVGRNASWKIVI